jgi:hypothetical protein
MPGSSHKKQNDQCEETKGLEWKLGHAAIPGVTDEQADQRIHVPQGVKLEQGKPSMCQAQQKRRDTQMPAVIKQWKKTTIQPAQGPDAKHNVQQLLLERFAPH